MRPSVEQTTVPLPDGAGLRDTVVAHSCLRNCMGHSGYAAGCCTMGTRDYIIGPIHDWAALLSRLSEREGREVPFDEVLIGFEEGSALFPDLDCWQQPECYPAIRVLPEGVNIPCHFLGEDNLCTIHDIRSETCRAYHCDHVRELLERL